MPRATCTNSAGSGKTRCEIDSWDDDDVVLVVCPASVRENWAKEIEKWRPAIRQQVVIRSYDFFARAKKKLDLPKFTHAVLDESTYIKAWTAKRTQVLCGLVLPGIPKIHFLSASPIKKSALDIHPTMTLLEGPACEDERTFAEKYCNQSYDYFKKCVVFSGTKLENAAELKARWDRYNIKFTKADIAKDLPPIVQNILYLQDEAKPAVDYRSVDYDHVTEAVKTEYQRIGLLKIPHVMEFLETADVVPTIFFVHHRNVHTELKKALEKSGRKCGSIIGGSQDKQQQVDAFQSGIIDYLVISMDAGGIGLDIPRAQQVLFCELPWDYVTLYQSMNRAHRLSTQCTVFVTLLVMVGTLDDGLLARIDLKQDASEAVVGDIQAELIQVDSNGTQLRRKKQENFREGTSNEPAPENLPTAGRTETNPHPRTFSKARRGSGVEPDAGVGTPGESTRPHPGGNADGFFQSLLSQSNDGAVAGAGAGRAEPLRGRIVDQLADTETGRISGRLPNVSNVPRADGGSTTSDGFFTSLLRHSGNDTGANGSGNGAASQETESEAKDQSGNRSGASPDLGIAPAVPRDWLDISI